MSLTSLSLWISPRSSESEVAAVNSTWRVVSQPPERCKATTQQNMSTIWQCVCVLVCVSVLHDAMSHFDRSFVYKDSVKFSISARGAGELEASVLLYFWFCSFCSCSRTCCSTSATVVNLNVKKHKLGQKRHVKTLKVKVLLISSHHFSRLSRQVSTGLPMQAICCLHFHSGSSTSVRVATISFVSFKMFTICCSNICATKTQKTLSMSWGITAATNYWFQCGVICWLFLDYLRFCLAVSDQKV